MCTVTILPGGYTDNEWFTQETSHLHGIDHQMICPTQINVTPENSCTILWASPITYLSPNENSHVKVLNIAEHCWE